MGNLVKKKNLVKKNFEKLLSGNRLNRLKTMNPSSDF